MNAASWVVLIIVILAAIGGIYGIIRNFSNHDDGPRGGGE